MNEGKPVDLKHAEAGDPMHDACFEAMNRMREATIAIVKGQDDPRDGLSIVMTAAQMFSGIMAGTLLAVGALQDKDRRRMGEAALTNFRQGIKLGLESGMRSYAEELGGRA